MFKADHARELANACTQLGWVSEPTLANRFLHNSVIVRDTFTIEEVTRALHLQAGFAIRAGLWIHSCVYGTLALNFKHSLKWKEHSGCVAAVGSEFPGRQLMLGQLVY